MTALQWIVKEAKAIRKKSPKMEWKKAVAQASAIYAKKHKGISPVGKKHAVKKKAAKKVAKKKAVGKVTLKKANYHARDERYIIMNDGKAHLQAQPFFKEDAKRIAKALRSVKAKRKKAVKKVNGVKKSATKKAVKSAKHIDTKSHNVNIHVMSGISNKALQDLKVVMGKIATIEKQILNHKVAIKKTKNIDHKNIYKKQLIGLKKYLSELKTHARELKKHI